MKKKMLTDKVVYTEFGSFLSQLPNPADIITGRLGAVETYKEMLLDEKIGSLWELRKNKTLDIPFFFSPSEDERTNALIDRIPEKLIRQLEAYLLDAKIYGHRPVDITWKLEDGYWIPDAVGAADIDRFSYNGEGQLFITTNGARMPAEQPFRWLIHRNDGSKRDKPYGESILNRVFWAWSFKKLGLEFWVQMEKKFAVPSFLAIFESDDPDKGKTTEIATEITNALAQILSGSSGAMANVKELVQVKAEGSVADFRTLCDYCNEAISVGLTSQLLATGTTDNGNRALGEVHEETLNALIRNDSRALAYTIQKLIDWTVMLNYSGAKAPQFGFDTKQGATFEQVLSAIDRGIPVSKSALYTQYGLPQPEDEADTFTPSPAAIPGASLSLFADDKKKRPLILLKPKS